MLKFVSYDIVFQEVPDEITLALNLSGCPNRCPGCHSPHLREDIGEELTLPTLERLLAVYADAVTCLCFMGGDAAPDEVAALARSVKRSHGLKTAWYSGCDALPPVFDPSAFDFVKIGSYRAESGDLRKPTTNQRFYKITAGRLTDVTRAFWP